MRYLKCKNNCIVYYNFHWYFAGRLDSDSEYDSEMDDFIDDGDENMDYSKHIKEIFGYDKSK